MKFINKLYKENEIRFAVFCIMLYCALNVPVRVALTGRRNTPDLYAITAILGEDTVRARLQKAKALLG